MTTPHILFSNSTVSQPSLSKIAPPLPCAFATTTDEIAPPPPRAKIAPPFPLAFATTTNEIALYDDLAHHNELAIARAFLRHSVKFVLPAHYRLDVTHKMRFIGVDTKNLSKTNAVLIVKFLTPQSLIDSTMLMYCTSLEPKRGLSQGADISILTVLKYTLFQAKSLYGIGVRAVSAADITRAMLADSNSVKGGPYLRNPSRMLGNIKSEMGCNNEPTRARAHNQRRNECGGSLSTSVTVYTKHVHVMFHQLKGVYKNQLSLVTRCCQLNCGRLCMSQRDPRDNQRSRQEMCALR